jgi:hypothetical protein
MDVNLKDKPWGSYVEEDIRELLEESLELLETVPAWEEHFHDYAFVVFPAAKGYEGFLKKLFFDMGFITNEDYMGKRFRIGRALNPSLEPRLREESIYDKLTKFTGNKELADKLWDTWKEGRNLIFHWFPDERRAITFDQAKSKIYLIIAAIDEAFIECKIKKDETRTEERKSL